MKHNGPEMTREVSGGGRRIVRCGGQERADAAQAADSSAVLPATKEDSA